MNVEKSSRFFSEAKKNIPGGVNSPVRACKSVGMDPVFINHADGAYIYDEDGNKYIDFVSSWGPMILGHRHPFVIEAIEQVLKRGTSFGAPTALEVELANMIVESIPSIELVRMVNSGTEATMSAIRLSRAFTKRDLIVKFDGCYHGHADTLLVEAGSGVATLGIPGSPGVPESFVQHTLSLPYNDTEQFTKIMKEKGDQIACVIVEPIAGNMGLVPPIDGFLETLRKLTTQYGSLLIFDEVISGFRVSYGGAQALYNILPDLSCYGKIIGGGLPVGAYGGRKDIMENIAPQGAVYQAGTLSGNPMAMAAGIATLKVLKQPDFYKNLNARSKDLTDQMNQIIKRYDIEAHAKHIGSLIGFFFTKEPVLDFEDAKKCNLNKFSIYYREMLQQGIYLAPSQFESMFVSAAHGTTEIEKTLNAFDSVLNNLSK